MKRAFAWLSATDPGLRRLITATRSTLTWLIVVAVLLAWTQWADISIALIIPGMLVVSAATMSLGMDLRPCQRFVALLLTSVSSALALTLGTLVSTNRVLTSVVFLAIGVAALGAYLLGPAGLVVALGAVVAFYASTLVLPTWDTLPVCIASSIIGAVLSALLLGLIFRDRPARDAARYLASVSAAIHTAAAADNKKKRDRRLRRLRTSVSAARSHALEYPGAWPPSTRTDAAAELNSITAEFESTPDLPAAERTAIAMLDVLRLQVPSARSADHIPRTAQIADTGGRPLIGLGVQLITAVTLAMLVAQIIDPRYWFWCVLAALVMLFGTSSAADSIGKGARRVLGTAVALPFGILLGVFTADHVVALVIVVVLAMFAQQYLADISYAWSTFFLTLLLSVILVQVDDHTETILGIRLALTAIGAAIGCVVALTVLPARTRPLLRRRASSVLDAAIATLEAIAQGRPEDEVKAATHIAHHRFEQLTKEAAAAKRGWPLSPRQARLQLELAALAMRELQLTTDSYIKTENVTTTDRLRAGNIIRSLSLIQESQVADQRPRDERRRRIWTR